MSSLFVQVQRGLETALCCLHLASVKQTCRTEDTLLDIMTQERKMILIQNNPCRESFRFCTYNVLADGPAYALSEKFRYCHLADRVWESRLPKLLSEILGYNADLVSLQELQDEPFSTYQRDFLPVMEVCTDFLTWWPCSFGCFCDLTECHKWL